MKRDKYLKLLAELNKGIFELPYHLQQANQHLIAGTPHGIRSYRHRVGAGSARPLIRRVRFLPYNGWKSPTGVQFWSYNAEKVPPEYGLRRTTVGKVPPEYGLRRTMVEKVPPVYGEPQRRLRTAIPQNCFIQSGQEENLAMASFNKFSCVFVDKYRFLLDI
jgi:hypothetical protein